MAVRDPCDLGEPTRGLVEVFEHFAAEHEVEAVIGERELVDRRRLELDPRVEPWHHTIEGDVRRQVTRRLRPRREPRKKLVREAPFSAADLEDRPWRGLLYEVAHGSKETIDEPPRDRITRVVLGFVIAEDVARVFRLARRLV